MRASFAQFVFDDATRQLLRGGAPVHLSPKAFHLLQLLIQRRPQAVSKKDLIEEIWPDVVVEESNLKVLITEVRKALSGAPVIRTVHRFGYAFDAVVTGDQPQRTSARLVGANSSYALMAGANSIGRDPQCTIVLNALGISRVHASIDVSTDQNVLRDLDSKNGTAVNGVRIEGPVRLRDGDAIQLGVVTLTFRSQPAIDSTVTVELG